MADEMTKPVLRFWSHKLPNVDLWRIRGSIDGLDHLHISAGPYAPTKEAAQVLAHGLRELFSRLEPENIHVTDEER